MFACFVFTEDRMCESEPARENDLTGKKNRHSFNRDGRFCRFGSRMPLMMVAVSWPPTTTRP
ncbi:hypothetical protein EMIT0194MI4_80218 [Pseudomonas sp. IT-194MI4]